MGPSSASRTSVASEPQTPCSDCTPHPVSQDPSSPREAIREVLVPHLPDVPVFRHPVFLTLTPSTHRKLPPCPHPLEKQSNLSVRHGLIHSFIRLSCHSFILNSNSWEDFINSFHAVWANTPVPPWRGGGQGVSAHRPHTPGAGPGSVLQLAGVRLSPVQRRPPVHGRVRGLRGPQGLGDGLLRDLGVVRRFPVRTAHVPDRGDEAREG